MKEREREREREERERERDARKNWVECHPSQHYN